MAYVGDAVTWLGGTVGVKDISTQVVGHNIVQDLDQASDLKLSLSLPSDFDHSLLQYGNEVVYQLGLAGESAIDIARLTMDTPGHAVDGYGQQIELVCRGALKKLISFTSPMDQTIDSALGYHFDFKQGGLYARKGVWSHETSGVAYCERHDGADALATIGIQYKGQFQIQHPRARDQETSLAARWALSSGTRDRRTTTGSTSRLMWVAGRSSAGSRQA